MEDNEVCKHENFDSELMKYCPDCQQAITICPTCQGNVETEWKYCPFCGTQLDH